MAYTHKGGESHSPLNYDQLAELYRASKSDAVAAIKFDMLSPADKRLAKQVHDIYATGLSKSRKPKVIKAKNAKPVTEKSVRKAEKDALKARLQGSLLSDDPWEREAAREALGEL